MNEFSERLKLVLKQKGITQYSLAKTIFVSQSVMNEYCTGKKIPSLMVFKAICKALDESADYLLGLVD